MHIIEYLPKTLCFPRPNPCFLAIFTRKHQFDLGKHTVFGTRFWNSRRASQKLALLRLPVWQVARKQPANLTSTHKKGEMK